MAARDGVPIDSPDPRGARYVGAQRINLASCNPARRASLVIDNTD
jgi:uridine kinase